MIVILSIIVSIVCTEAKADNWLTDSIIINSTPSTAKLNHGAWVFGGDTSIKIPTSSFHPFHVALPKISGGGCGGIDVFWGGFSLMDPEMLVQYAQNILAAAPSYAFDLALQALCEPCQGIKTSLNKIASDLNNHTLDSCRDAKRGLDFITSYMPTQAIKGEINSQSKEYLGNIEKSIAGFSTDVDNIFNTQLLDNDANLLEKMLVIPEQPDHYLSFWVSIVGHKMCSASPDFSVFDAGMYEAAASFFSSPKEFIEFVRAITGDLLFARGGDGVQGSSDAGKKSGWTRAENFDYKVVSDRFGTIYQDKGAEDTPQVMTINDVTTPTHPVLSINENNRLWGLKLPNEPDASYIGAPGYKGFSFVRDVPGGSAAIPDQELTIMTLANPANNCATPKDCAKDRINKILDNIRERSGGTQTTPDDFVAFNAMPVYVFTNRVGMLSVKFPGIIDEVRDNIATVAGYSYATARLNASLTYAEMLLIEGRTAALNLKKKKFEGSQGLEDWVNSALTNIERARNENTKFMAAKVKSCVEEIVNKVKYYRDIEDGITRTVSASAFNSIYAADWK
ncbi:MAG: conjugal transfer protein TraH [Pseudomonadota bacterium]